MKNEQLQRRFPSALAERGHYVLAFLVVTSMWLVAGYPVFVVFFFGVFAYFLWKVFTGSSRNETREIFEFYLAAQEVLRDDDRCWYGFELRELAARGERIAASMALTPPLVLFALGALYFKLEDHKTAAEYLSRAIEGDESSELRLVTANDELRDYVRVLRKIEREPAEAPMTSAAVRSLERARRLRGAAILAQSREKVERALPQTAAELSEIQGREKKDERSPVATMLSSVEEGGRKQPASITKFIKREQGDRALERFADRKPISEVLHDIYDKNVQ